MASGFLFTAWRTMFRLALSPWLVTEQVLITYTSAFSEKSTCSKNNVEIITIFKTLGEETRFLIIKELLKRELCACQIPSLIGRTQSNTSMHLSKLHNLGYIKSIRDGRSIIYSIADKNIKTIMTILKA